MDELLLKTEVSIVDSLSVLYHNLMVVSDGQQLPAGRFASPRWASFTYLAQRGQKTGEDGLIL